jgi:hypothetical protein
LRAAPPEGLDEWSRRHLEKLADLEALAPGAAVGDTLLHFDIRADNVLIGPDGRVWFFDWPHAYVGAAWFDTVAFAPCVTMQGGSLYLCQVTRGGPVERGREIWRPGSPITIMVPGHRLAPSLLEQLAGRQPVPSALPDLGRRGKAS